MSTHGITFESVNLVLKDIHQIIRKYSTTKECLEVHFVNMCDESLEGIPPESQIARSYIQPSLTLLGSRFLELPVTELKNLETEILNRVKTITLLLQIEKSENITIDILVKRKSVTLKLYVNYVQYLKITLPITKEKNL